MIKIQEPADLVRGAATSAGYYLSPLGSKHPKVQIMTVAELLEGRKVDYPSQGGNVTFEKALRERKQGKRSELVIR